MLVTALLFLGFRLWVDSLCVVLSVIAQVAGGQRQDHVLLDLLRSRRELNHFQFAFGLASSAILRSAMQINFGTGSRLWIDNLDAAEVGHPCLLPVTAGSSWRCRSWLSAVSLWWSR